jgi:predicted dehydrogenase/threonine dehydrogenase-like Zn-dependent dehydrogenase
MKAVVQNYGNGVLEVVDIPAPAVRPGGLLVRTEASVVSAGTEKSMVDLARRSLLGKARERPDLVRQVIAKINRDGLAATVETVRRRLDTPITLGYSSAGTVVEVGPGVEGFSPGDRVACAGAGYAAHAELVFVPRNLVVPVPDGVSAEDAAFTTLGAIALQGLRLAEPQLGETVAVVGLGLLGLLGVQMARAAGCRVLGIDPDPARCELARSLGAVETDTDPEGFARLVGRLTAGLGVDRVLVTAGTRSSGPVRLAGEVARLHGTVVVVGAVGMDLPRKPYFDKELVFRVSRSYGPGRYDPEYEEKGRDYPFGLVRWTENRNMAAFVALLAEGKVTPARLVSHRFPLAEASRAYDLLTGTAGAPYLGILLDYPAEPSRGRRLEMGSAGRPVDPSAALRLGVLGAGSFTTGVLLPVLARLPGVEPVGICTAGGVSARHAAGKFGFRYATTDEAELIGDDRVNTVLIGTRHHLHARQVIASLAAGRHVFVEKPLCLSRDELDRIGRAYAGCDPRPLLMVGYNRRFAPLSIRLREFVAGMGEPMLIHYRVNAGFIPPEHWVQDREVGGGRVIGEVCHFIDYLIFLTGALPVKARAGHLPDGGRYRGDNLQILVEMADGSVGSIMYAANGDRSFPKERVEVFGGGMSAVLDNFRSLSLFRGGRSATTRTRLTQDKGHRGEWLAFLAAVRSGGPSPIPFEELAASTGTAIDLADAAGRDA